LKLEFKEPYPIYRGFFVPIWEEKPVKVRRVTEHDIKLFKEALDRLRRLLENLKCKDIKVLADAIAIFFKAPLIQEISPILPSPLKAYALWLLIPELLKEFCDDLYNFAKVLSNLRPEYLQTIDVLFDKETAEIVEKLWLHFPADTRPGYNTSSLIAHLLITSAIAWALEKESNADEEWINKVRLVCLLHDIGKVVNPKEHTKASKEIANYILDGILDKATVDEICELIEKHHRKDVDELSLMRWADRLSSAADRITEIVNSIIGWDIERVERITGKKRNTWECWENACKIEGDIVKYLTEKVVDTKITVTDREENETKVKLILVDIGEIQNFIYKNQELRSIAMASHIIDLIVHSHLILYFNAKGLNVPPEAVVYSGGGNILLIVPERYVDKIEKLAKKYEKKIKTIKLYLAKTEFSTNYAKLRRRLEEEIARSKYSITPEKTINEYNEYEHLEVEKICRLCYSSIAYRKVETAEGIKEVCKTCKELYDGGSDIHFSKKWEAEIEIINDRFSPKDAFERNWKDVKMYIMEIIAGHEAKEIERIGIDITLRDVAVIKFDGNLMGIFMREAISFTDAIERSFRVDVALKKAYRKALETIYISINDKDEARRTCARIFLGTIYMGGDDGLILTPSWIALPFAHMIAEEFTRQLGLKRGMSIGIAIGSARMNVWSLIDSSSSLMSLAKKFLRNYIKDDSPLSSLCFFVFDNGSPSGDITNWMLRRLSPKLWQEGEQEPDTLGLSMQPYILKPDDSEFWKLFYPLIFGHGNFSYERIINSKYERIRRIRNIVMSCWNAIRNSKYWKELAIVYIKRQMSRDEKDTIYDDLFEFIKRAYLEQKAVPFADILMMCKTVRGDIR